MGQEGAVAEKSRGLLKGEEGEKKNALARKRRWKENLPFKGGRELAHYSSAFPRGRGREKKKGEGDRLFRTVGIARSSFQITLSKKRGKGGGKNHRPCAKGKGKKRLQ